MAEAKRPDSGSSGVLISGYYGFGNAGDEAVLSAMIQLLRARGVMGITVLSGSPAETEAVHGVRAVSRNDPRAVWSEMRRAELLLSGGGSLFQDATSVQSVVFYYAVLGLARLARLPLMIFAQGVGPLRSPVSRALVASGFNHARAITVRDGGSAALLKQIGVRVPVEVTADPVFALEPASRERAREILAEEAVPDEPFIAIALRPWPGIEESLSAISAALDRFSRESGLQCVFVPMQPEADRPLSQHVADGMETPRCVLKGGYPPRETMAILGRARIVLAMRLHALIFAAAQGVPVLGISYDPKVDELLGELGVSSETAVGSLSAEGLLVSLESLARSRDQEAERLRARSGSLRDKALRNAEVAESLLRALSP